MQCSPLADAAVLLRLVESRNAYADPFRSYNNTTENEAEPRGRDGHPIPRKPPSDHLSATSGDLSRWTTTTGSDPSESGFNSLEVLYLAALRHLN